VAFVLDALAEGLQAEQLADLDEHPDEHESLGRRRRLRHEAAVDLDRVDRKRRVLRERGQAAVAGRAQPMERGLADLEGQGRGLERGVAERVLEVRGEVGVRELARGDVDRHPQRAPLAPTRRLSARGAQHPAADRHDQAGRLGDGEGSDRADRPHRG